MFAKSRANSALSGKAQLYIGRLAEARESAGQAWTVNALVRPTSALLCWISFLAGDYDNALRQISDIRVSGDTG